MPMDHDRLFKELLTTFFAEFIELFLPDVAAELDRSSIHFLDKEIFTDVGSGDRHEVDLLARARLRDREACILIHVENQSSPQADFAQRMFQYYSRIECKFNLPVFPIAVFSYDRPLTQASSIHSVELFNLRILRFEFHAIQLNLLDWRTFLRTPNPVASALMVKMQIATEDRPHVKAQCARMIATLRLNPAKTRLIAVFMNSYLRLNPAELIVYNQDMQNIAPEEKQFILEIENEWTRMGKAEGQVEGRIATVTRLLRRRFGSVPKEIEAEILNLSLERLDELADALLDFKSLSDAQAWISQK